MRQNSFTITVSVGVGLLMTATTALAHHSFAAQFDPNKEVTLTGHVTKVEWMNPHTYFYVDVEDENGNVVNWAVEGGPPNVLYRNGWKPDSLKVGDEITIIGRLARNGTNLANGRSFIVGGKCLFTGTSDPDGAATECREQAED